MEEYVNFPTFQEKEIAAKNAEWKNIGASCICICGDNANSHSFGSRCDGFKVDPCRNILRKNDQIWMQC